MNPFELMAGREAELEYLDGEVRVVTNGSFVRCAVTGDPIALEDLKYWSVDRQEAYRDCEASFARELEIHPEWRRRED